jgi:2-haloacid dehalogenase
MDSAIDVLKRTTTITFDCFGTLIDWSAGLWRSFGEIFGPVVGERKQEWFDAYVRAEAEVESGPYRSYREVLAVVTERLAREFDLPLPAGREAKLAEMLPGWAPFPDTNDALARLKQRFRLGVLSNIDNDLFAGTAKQFGIAFDFVVTAEEVRSYKPAQGHFQRLIDAHGGTETVLHVAQSLYHDGAPANEFGVAFVWINRYKERNHTPVRPLAEFPDLRSFADAACPD